MMALFVADLAALALVIGTVIVTLRQPPDDGAEANRSAMIGFLASVACFIGASTLALWESSTFASAFLSTIVINIRFATLIWSVVAAFSLIVTNAGLMREGLQVMARTGVAILLVLQWPLWEGYLFHDPMAATRAFPLLGMYDLAGITNVLILLFYVGTAAFFLWLHQPPSLLPTGRVALYVLLAGQALSLIRPESEILAVLAVVAAIAGIILMYKRQPSSKLVSN